MLWLSEFTWIWIWQKLPVKLKISITVIICISLVFAAWYFQHNFINNQAVKHRSSNTALTQPAPKLTPKPPIHSKKTNTRTSLQTKNPTKTQVNLPAKTPSGLTQSSSQQASPSLAQNLAKRANRPEQLPFDQLTRAQNLLRQDLFSFNQSLSLIDQASDNLINLKGYSETAQTLNKLHEQIRQWYEMANHQYVNLNQFCLQLDQASQQLILTPTQPPQTVAQNKTYLEKIYQQLTGLIKIQHMAHEPHITEYRKLQLIEGLKLCYSARNALGNLQLENYDIKKERCIRLCLK